MSKQRHVPLRTRVRGPSRAMMVLNLIFMVGALALVIFGQKYLTESLTGFVEAMSEPFPVPEGSAEPPIVEGPVGTTVGVAQARVFVAHQRALESLTDVPNHETAVHAATDAIQEAVGEAVDAPDAEGSGQ